MQGVLNSLNGAAITNASVLDGLNLKQAQLLLTTKGLSAEKQKELLVNAGLMASEDKVTLTLMKQAFMSSSLGDEEKERALIKLGLIDRNTKEAISEAVCTKKDIEALVAQGLLNEEQKEGILAILGLDTANKSASVSLGLFTKGIWANIKAMAAWMVSNPLGWLILAGVTIAGAAGLVDLFTTSVKEHEENLENLKSEYSEIKSELDGLNSELQTTQQRISELESKDKLTFTEGEELENLRKQNNELQRSIDLAKLKEKEANKKKNAEFVTTMSADVDNAEMTVQTGQNPDGSVKQEIINETAYIERQYKLLQEYRDKLKQDGLTENEKKIYQSYIDDIEKYISEKNDEFAKRAEGIDYIQNPTTEDDKKVNEWLDYINDFQDKMAIAMGGDNAKENAFNRLVDNWKFDELLNPLQKLGKEGKVTAEMLNDPKYDAFIQKLIDIEFISDDTEGSLRFVASAFNGTMQSAQKYVTSLKGNEINNFIKNLNNEAKALGTTESELAKLTAAHVIFNNTGLSTEQQQQALQMLAAKIATTSAEMKYLLRLFNVASGNFDAVGASTLIDSERASRTAKTRKYLKDKYGIDLSPIEIPEKEEIENPYNPTDDDKDNTPSYEDPTEAIINRINLRSKELAQQEEEIQNLIEIAELENDYKKQISLTNDKLALQKQRLNELKTANAGLHNEAEYQRSIHTFYNKDGTESDENLWFDSQGNATMYYNALINKTGITTEEREAIEDLFEKLSKYKKAYAENTEEIVGLNKEILQTEEDILDLDYGHSQDWIDERNTYNDWALFNDSEIDAWERVIKRLKEDYKDCAGAAEKLKEAEENLFEARKDQFDKATDFGSSYLDSRKTLLESHYEVTNAIREAQHEINKELKASKTMYEWLDEDTRKLLFNQEDYNILSEELYDIQYKADKLRRQYERDLENSTLNTIEEITSNYEMQYDMLMKSYEIAKADLEVAKKKQKLNNVLNERNVRMFINGQWQWVADTQNVIDAQSELADAEYARKTAIAGERQTESLNDLTKQQDKLGTIINKFEDGVITLDNAMDDVADIFGRLPDYIEDAFAKIQGTSTKTSTLSSGSSSSSVNSSSKKVNTTDQYVTNSSGHIQSNPNWDGKNKGGIGSFYKHADGTRYTPGGLTALGEIKPEMFIDNNGHLIPINQPTIGNIGSGGIVFNQEQMGNLRDWWDLSNIAKPYYNFVGERKTQQVVSHDNRIIINGMTVDSGSTNGQALINALRRYVGNH